MSKTPRTNLDHQVYEENGKWHFTILQLPDDGRAGFSSAPYESKAHHRAGYQSEQDAHDAALQKKQEM